MKKLTRWVVIVLVLSGWVVSGFLYVNFKKEKAKTETELAELRSELQSYQFLISDVEKSAQQIDGIIKTLGELKDNLKRFQNRVEKGVVKNESSENGK